MQQSSSFLSDRVAMFTQTVGMTASDWPVSRVVKRSQTVTTETGRLFFRRRTKQSLLSRNVFELSPRALQLSARDHIPSRS